MSVVTESAPAKINLTLKVHGRRPDGYHELESLIAFTAVTADTVSLEPGAAPGLEVSGPFRDAIDGPNLIETALRRLVEADAGLVLGRVRLEKNLPVAAGIGGGSSDAAALLRAVRRANPQRAGGVDWYAIAKSLGADVPVCLEALPAYVCGIGETVLPVADLPRLDVILVNPLAPVPADKTGRVFSHLNAAPVDSAPDAGASAPHFREQADLIARMGAVGNDLTDAATAVVPEVAEVRAALAALPGVLYAGLSGAGPTSFAVFASAGAAHEAVGALSQAHPGWWVAADTLMGSGQSTSR